MHQRMLEGEVSNHFSDIEPLRRENAKLREDLTNIREALLAAHARIRDLVSAQQHLQEYLMPFRKLIGQIFDEFETQDLASSDVQASQPANSNVRWEHWKKTLPPRAGQIIDLLLIHGSMSVMQLATAMKVSRENLYKNVIPVLNKAGVLTKDGQKYCLKES